MSDRIVFDLSSCEIGNAIGNGMWLPYLYRKITGRKVKVISPVAFSKTWWEEWFDEYEITQTSSDFKRKYLARD